MPDDGRRYELLEGEIQVNAAPTTRHQRISRNLEFVLHAHVEARGLGEVFNAPTDVLLARGTVVQPDLLFVSTKRLGIVTERAVEGPPDLAVEILSSGTAAVDLGAKLQLYARYGIAHDWVVDPAARTISEHELQRDAYVLRATHRDDRPCKTTLFPDLAIDLARVFG